MTDEIATTKIVSTGQVMAVADIFSNPLQYTKNIVSLSGFPVYSSAIVYFELDSTDELEVEGLSPKDLIFMLDQRNIVPKLVLIEFLTGDNKEPTLFAFLDYEIKEMVIISGLSEEHEIIQLINTINSKYS